MVLAHQAIPQRIDALECKITIEVTPTYLPYENRRYDMSFGPGPTLSHKRKSEIPVALWHNLPRDTASAIQIAGTNREGMAAASAIGHCPPAWDHSIPGSDDYSEKAPFSVENYYGKDFAGLCFNDSALSPFQTTAVSPAESDCISSPILDVEMALNFWGTSMDIMESIPWDLSLDQPTYGGLPTAYLSQDVQTASDYTRTTAHRQQSDAISLRGKGRERDSTRSLVDDDEGSTRKLRTASRKSKNSGGKNRSPASQKEDHQISFAQKRARDYYNRVEK
ncbi:hypothetical protein ACJZ2D_016939 [Fusarium nematophilum]